MGLPPNSSVQVYLKDFAFIGWQTKMSFNIHDYLYVKMMGTFDIWWYLCGSMTTSIIRDNITPFLCNKLHMFLLFALQIDNQLENGCSITYSFTERQSLVSSLWWLCCPACLPYQRHTQGHNQSVSRQVVLSSSAKLAYWYWHIDAFTSD